MSDAGCVFCKIAAEQADAHIIDENELSISILDIQPLARGHCLVIPRRHVPWWHDLTPEETASLFELARVTAGRIQRALSPDFVAMYVRGRRIPHTHVFLVPTWLHDPLDRFFNALEGFQESADAMAGLRANGSRAEVAEILRRS